LRIKYQIEVEYRVLDCTEIHEQQRVIDSVFSRVDTPVARVFVAIGLLGSDSSSADWEQIKSVLEVNFTSMVSLLSRITPKLVAQGSGTLICLSSVAGDRGRATNLVYGAAKAGLTAYLSGLRNVLSDTPIRVMTVKPGPVDTAMTAKLKKSAIFASPDRVACDIDRADRKQKLVVYTPGWWRLVMFVIRCLPERVFMRLRF
jgi:short-subunit dehydrogenase